MKHRLLRVCLVLLVMVTLASMIAPAASAQGEKDSESVDGPAPIWPGNPSVTFQGTIASKEGSEWVVSGITVHLNEQTVIIETAGPADIGALVSVSGVQQQDRSVLAKVIRVLRTTQAKRPVNFSAPIVALPPSGVIGEWTVGTETVVVSDTTKILPQGVVPQVQDIAHVVGFRNNEGKVDARLIEIRNPSLVKVQFVGPIMRFSATEWVVRNVTVMITSDTDIEGTPAVGLIAEVTGFKRPDGTVVATHIKVRMPPEPTITFQGIIMRKSAEEPPAVWGIRPVNSVDTVPRLVNVNVTEDTVIDTTLGDADVGALVQVVAVPTPMATSAAEVTLVAKRIKVLRPAINQEITFAGTIDEIHDAYWIVRGVRVLISDSTVIEGLTPEVGLMAVVTGTLLANRVVDATHITVKEALPDTLVFDGVLREKSNALPGRWMIAPDGPLTVILPIWVTLQTTIDETAGPAKVGAHVHVVAHRSVSGQLVAVSITVLPPVATP